jgi:hypothetical protein
MKTNKQKIKPRPPGFTNHRGAIDADLKWAFRHWWRDRRMPLVREILRNYVTTFRIRREQEGRDQ